MTDSLIIALAILAGAYGIMSALDRLNASITNLNTAVDAAVAKLSAASDDSAVNAAADAVDAAVAKLNGAALGQDTTNTAVQTGDQTVVQ